MDMNQRSLYPPVPHGRRVVRLLRTAIVAFLVVFVLGSASVAAAWFGASQFSAYGEVDSDVLLGAIEQVGYASIGESPHITSLPPTGPVPICRDVPTQLIKPLRRAFGLMRGTSEGQRLFQMLVDSDVCVTIDDLPYNAAYAFSRETSPDNWSASRIVIDRSLVRSSMSDTLAAILVHESTHIDRAVSGEACLVSDKCDRLPNGVEIDEEIAAHTAEAEWWIAAFGSDGKRFAFRSDYGENHLAKAYLEGEDAFRDYVTSYRSDPREGEGI
jgi:hypothetical protein